MKVKLLGLRFKFLLAATLSIILGLFISLIINELFLGHTNNGTYNDSTNELNNIVINISSSINKFGYEDINAFKSPLIAFQNKYKKYNLAFIISDSENNQYYRSGNFKTLDSSLSNEYNKTLSIASYQNGNYIKEYYNFVYQVPIVTVKRTFILWIEASPTKSNASGLKMSSMPLFILLSSILFYLLTFPKIKYIGEISKGLSNIANGNLSFRIEKKGNDEISNIALNINIMADKVQEKIDDERKLETSKQELIVNIAHDLRTPLTSILGYMDMLEKEEYKNYEEMKKYINVVLTKSQNLKCLTDNLFMVSKLSSNNINLNLQAVCLNELLEQIVDEYFPIFEEKTLQLSAEISDKKIIVNIDIELFIRLFDNLLSNALKYSNKPSTVLVNLENYAKNAVISIKNPSPFMSHEDMDKLFERFYRVDKSRSNSNESSGLGLAISKNIVELHGGSIFAKYIDESVTFVINVPIIEN